jgi:seryl-tRNA(Sec) selenium transferase
MQVAAAETARNVGATVCRVAFDASRHDLTVFGLPSTTLPTVWDGSADLVIAPSHYFLAGPEGCLILGRFDAMKPIRRWVETMGWESGAVERALLLESLQATKTLDDWKQTPIGATLSTGLQNLENRARRIAIQLENTPMISDVRVDKRELRVGTAPWNSTRQWSAVLQIVPKDKTPSAFADLLSTNKPPIWCNVNSEYLELVMRTIEPDEDRLVVQSLTNPPI